MRTYEIKRHESGRFYLRIIQGYGLNYHCYDWDLALTEAESRSMLVDILKKFRFEDLPEADRQPLIDSISDLMPIPNPKITKVAKTGRTLPSDPVHHSMTFRLPRCN